MNDTIIGLDQSEVILVDDVSDDALETAAGTGREALGGAWTMMCSGISCPGGPAS